MIRAIHARSIVGALSSTAEAGPVFYALNRCLAELDEIVGAEEIESVRNRLVSDYGISRRLDEALLKRGVQTVRQLEAMSAEELVVSCPRTSIAWDTGGYPRMGVKQLREARTLLASLGMKLKEHRPSLGMKMRDQP